MINILDNVYGFLKVTSFSHSHTYPGGQKHPYFNCLCVCGNLKKIKKQHLISGRINSCGCKKGALISKAKTRHGFRNTKIYTVWVSMKSRCNNKNNIMYYAYGGRGISVCSQWLDSENFCLWSSNNGWEDGLQIDRINNNGNYEPENCRFITPLENCRNRRLIRTSNTSGYCGVSKAANGWVSRIMVEYNPINLGTYKSKRKAAIARDEFIIKNKLSFPLNILKVNNHE